MKIWFGVCGGVETQPDAANASRLMRSKAAAIGSHASPMTPVAWGHVNTLLAQRHTTTPMQVKPGETDGLSARKIYST